MKKYLYNSDKKTAYNSCKQILMELDCEILNGSIEHGIIEARKAGNFFSYGHKLTIKIAKSELIIISDSLGIQIIDWGTNTENEELFVKKLGSILK